MPDTLPIAAPGMGGHPMATAVLMTIGIVAVGIGLGMAASVLPLPKWRGWTWDGEE